MIDFLLKEYVPYKKGELENLLKNRDNDGVIEEHINILSKRYDRFSKVYKFSRGVITVIPVLALALYLAMPTYYTWVLGSALALIAIHETIIIMFFPRKYFEKINSNILILKSIQKLERDKNYEHRLCNTTIV